MDAFCSPSRWGPLEYPRPVPIGGDPDMGDFTPCFEELVLISIMSTGILLLGVVLSFKRFFGRMPMSMSATAPSFGGSVNNSAANYGTAREPLLKVRQPGPVDEAFKRYRFVFAVKLGVLILINVLFLLELILLLTNGPLFEIVATAISVFSWCLCIVLSILEYQRGLPTAPALIAFYLYNILAGTIKVRSIMRQLGIENLDYIFFVQYGLYFLILAIGMFSPSRSGHADDAIGSVSASGASWISKISYWWISPLLQRARLHTLMIYDTAILNNNDKSSTVREEVDAIIDKQLDATGRISIWRLIFSIMGRTFFMQGLATFMSTLSLFLGPFCMFHLINYVDGIYIEPPVLAAYLIGLLAGPLITSVLDQLFMHQGVHLGMKIRAAAVHLVVEKTTRLSLMSHDMIGTRALTSLVETDADCLRDLPLYLHRMWSAPLSILGVLLFLYNFLSYATFAGVGLMVLVIPVNVFISRMSGSIQGRLLEKADERVDTVSEFLRVVQAIKLLSLEAVFAKRLDAKRNEELRFLQRFVYFQSLSFLVWQGTPLLVTGITYGFYSQLVEGGHDVFDAGTVFVSLTLFNLLKMPLHLLPVMITKVREGFSSVNKLEEFLMYSEEVSPVVREQDKVSFVSINEGGFKWDNYDSELGLRNINVDLKPQQLSLIVGSRDSGKSSLLHAILGEMFLATGNLVVRGRIAFVADTPWLQNSSIRDNILSGLDYSVDSYEKTVLGCGLVKDFLLLDSGDAEIVGVSGIKISESLKQRICLARGVYAMLSNNADILILDDPLTAVESLLARRIVQDCINKTLRNRTRIISTSQLALFLPESQNVVVMNNGLVAEQGHHSVLTRQDGVLSDMLRNVKMFAANAEDDDEDHSDDEEVGKAISKRATSATSALSATPSSIDARMGRMMRSASMHNTEGPTNKGVPFSVWLSYLNMSGGSVHFVLTVFLFTLSQVGMAIQDFWMAWWTDHHWTELTHEDYFRIYCYLALYNLAMILLRSLAVAHGSLAASKRTHNIMLSAMMRSPVSFFINTPHSSVLNRVELDQQAVDQELSPEFSDLFTFVFMMLGMIGVISWVTPFFLVAMLPIGIVLNFVARQYISAARQLKRLDAESKTKIGDVYGELLQGLVSVRAANTGKHYIEEAGRLVDMNHRAHWSFMVTNRWLGLRLEFVGSMVVFFCGIFVCLYSLRISGSLAGISLLYSLSVTNMLNWLVRTIAEVDDGLAHYYRCTEFASIPAEAPPVVIDRRPPQPWPSRGKIVVENLVVSSQTEPTMAPILKGVSFETKKMEKIGIAVQQSSPASLQEATALIHALLRVVEPDDGQVRIDNVDVSPMGVADLRSAVSIVPRVPLVFTGSLRENIDPNGFYSDDDIRKTLEKVHLDEILRDFPEGLDFWIDPKEDSVFSYGQFQLLALARAMLKKSKVVIIEEISSHMDSTTDAILQKTIRTELLDCTIITVASSLKTIIDYDRILVLDKGLVVDFDTPAALLSNDSSHFYTMCLESGEYELLRQLAGQREYVLEELGASLHSGASHDDHHSLLNETYAGTTPSNTTSSAAITINSTSQYKRDASRNVHGGRAQSFVASNVLL